MSDKVNLDIFWLKDAVTRVKERPGFPSLENSADEIRCRQSEFRDQHREDLQAAPLPIRRNRTASLAPDYLSFPLEAIS